MSANLRALSDHPHTFSSPVDNYSSEDSAYVSSSIILLCTFLIFLMFITSIYLHLSLPKPTDSNSQRPVKNLFTIHAFFAFVAIARTAAHCINEDWLPGYFPLSPKMSPPATRVPQQFVSVGQTIHNLPYAKRETPFFSKTERKAGKCSII